MSVSVTNFDNWGGIVKPSEKGHDTSLRILKESMEKLDDLNPWVSAGTLLGLYRDGTFIKHDTDLDVGIRFHWDNYYDVDFFGELFPNPIRTMHYRDRPMQFAANVEDLIFDVYFFYDGVTEEGLFNANDHGAMVKPAYLVDTLKIWDGVGTKLWTPLHIEDYLFYRYGSNWNTPVTKKQSWENDAAPKLLRPLSEFSI